MSTFDKPESDLAKATPETVKQSGITIGRAEEKDLETLIAFSRDAHEESYFSEIPFSENKVRAFGAKVFGGQNPNMIALIAKKNDLPIGYVYALMGEYYVGSDTLLTTVHALHVSKGIRNSLLGGKVAFRLVRGIKLWSEQAGSKHVLFHITSGITPGPTDRFMRKMGFKTLGGNYVG